MHQIGAITGHKTLKEIERYTRAVEQVKLADSAMEAVSNAEQKPEQELANRSRKVAKSIK